MTLQPIAQKDLISQTHNIEAIEKKMLELPQEPCPVIHRFGPGIYMREVSMKAGTKVIGHHQNFEHMNIFLKGKIMFFNDKNEAVELTAPMAFVSPPGRKIAWIIEDAVWMNVYSTNETNVERLEAHFLTKSDVWKLDSIEREKSLLLTSGTDREDFLKAIHEFGLLEEDVRKISENTEDMAELPHGSYKIKVGPSKIDGTGLFATADISNGDAIAPARLSNRRTIAGRYTNHSYNPNAKMARCDGNIILIAQRNISGCHGGQDGEEITVNYRDALKLTLEIGHGGQSCQQ